jgi:transposase InsO family protein
MQLRERWLKLVGKTGITPVVTPPAAPEVKSHRISPIPNAPALNTASSTVRIETTVPGGGFFTRFVPSEALPPGDDIELKLVPFGPGNPFRKPPDTVRLLNLDKLREETKQKIRIMSVQNSTPEETINMDNAVGMACTKATIGKIQVIVSWDPGSGVSWITPSLIALLKQHEVPFYTVRVRDGRVGGWGGAQTTVLTAYYVWVRMGAGTKLLRLYLAPDAETDALRDGIMIGRDFNEEVGVQTIDGNPQLFPDDHHTITLADYGKVRVRLTMLDEEGIQQWTQSPVTVNGQVKITNITVIPPLESRMVNTTLRVNPDKVQYLDDTGKRPPLTVLVTPNSLNPSDHGLVVKGDRPNVVFCSTLITVQNTMVVSEDWELMVIPEPPEGFNCTHQSHHGITCPRHTKDPGDPHSCDFLPVALTQELEVHNPHDADVVLRPGEILGEATVGLHAQLQINAFQTPAMPSEQPHETLQLIPLREALSVTAVLEEGVFGQVVNTLMAFLLLGSMMIFQGGVDVVLMAVGMLPSQPDVGDLLAWIALFLTVTAVVFFSTCATLIPLRHTSLAQWWARWGAPSVMIPVTALVQETVHQVAPAHEGYWPVDCVLSLCTFLVLWWVWRALWTQLCTSGQRPRNLPPPSRSLWTAGNGAKPSSKAWSIPSVSLKYLLVLLALWVPFHHTNHSAWQYHRDSPVKVGNIALVSPPLTNVDVPDEPPEPEPPAWTKVTEEYNAGSFWTKDESTFLSGLQWYQRLSELGENISPTQFREAGDTLLGFRTLGDPVDFARESIPPLEHPDGTLKDALTIDTGDAEPIRTTPYPCGPKKKLMISTEIDRLVSQGICKRMCSPWGAPVVCVPKKDGTVRFCVSYVKLNAVTKRDAYPLHRFDSLPAFLRGKSIFSTLDLQQGFHQMPLHPDDQLKTAFVSHRGQFVFTVCPFGLTNAPATFQRMMDQVIGDLLYDTTFVFIDDSITASSSFDQHLSDLREVLSRYDANDLKVKLPKCYFFQPDIDYLGHNFDRMGVRPMYRNLQAISDFATPASVKDVRSFLGVIGYYREHMRSYASVAAPLFKLLKKGVVFNDEWGEPHVEAFRALKRAVAQKPMLRYPDPNLPFICSTDTSDYATGAVLSQEFPVAAHPDACQVQAKVTAEQSKMFEEGWYTKDALFHPTHCQGNFQVGERLFHSVKQYIAFKKARYFLLDELADKIALLIVTPEFENELSRLTVELEETLLKVEFYSEESWGLIEVQEWYSGTLAKFYCQPSYMDVLLQYKTVLRSKEGRADSMSDFALHAVQCRLRRLTEHLPLPEDRPVFERHPIAFYSSTLSPAEAKYDARERECLGVLRACEKFEFYTYGCPQLIIENDHLNLTHLYNDHEGRLLRWSWRLQRFAPFLVVHTPGKLQHVPDGLSRYLTSHYNTCDLKDMLYGAEEAYRPPFPEVLKVLADRLPESVTRCYDPITCHPETPKLWEELGISTLDSTDINFFDQDQRPSPTEYDAVITHGPYANIGTTVLALLSLDKPFAMLVPTLAITRPDSFLHLVQDLKLLLVSTVKQYSQRSKRDVPLHHVWVTKGLLKDQLEIVPLEPLDDTDGRAPERIEVVEPFLSLRDIKGFLPTDPDLSRSDMLSDSVVQFTKSNSIRTDLNEIGTRSDARQVPEAPWAKVAKLSVKSSNGPADKSGASQSVSGENYFPNDYPGLSTVAQDALTAAISTSGYRVPSTFAIRKNYSRKAPIQYEVEETLEHKIDQKGKRLFLVKWKDCPATDNTWEPEAGLSAFTLQTYWDRVLQDQNDLLKPDNIAKVLPAKHFPDDEVKKASAGLKQFKQDRDKQIAELEQELTEATDSNHSAKKLTDYARARIEDTLALLKDSEAEVEDVDGYEDSLYPPDPEPKHMSFPRLQQFRTAQMSDLVLGELIGAQTLQEVDPADSKEEVEYYLVCKGQHPVKNSLLLLKQKAEVVIKAEDPLTQLSPTKYGLLTASSEQEAARLVTRMMVQAQNPTTDAVAANRFKRKCVQLSNDGPKFHYLEVQLTRNETEDLSIHERFAHVTWRTAKQISQLSSKQLTTNGDEVNTIRYTKATTVLTCALRDSTLHNSQKSFPANLVVKEGLLYYVEQHSQKARLVVPRSLRLNLLFIAHDSPTSGHRGAAAVLRTLQNRYWWPQMRRDIFHYCKGCLPCNQSKATSRTRLKYMQPYAPCERGHMIHIDHFGPFPPSADGNTVVLSVIDRATSYCWAYACKDSTSETVAEVLYQRHFLEHGYPVCIVSDNGPAFASELIAHLDRICEVKHLFTTPYRPQSNGKVERIHRVFKAALQMYVDPQHSDWDKRLASIVYAMRTTPQDSEIYTPFFLWHGRHPVTPLELLSGHYDKEMEHQELVLSAMQTQLEAAKIVELFKRQRDDKAQKGLPQSGEPPDWENGQMVLVKRPRRQEGLATKLLYQWVGPYIVRKRITPVNYSLDLGNGRSQTYHVSRLHDYYQTTHPVGKHVGMVDLFDIESVEMAEDVRGVSPLLPLEPYQLHHMLLFNHHGEVKMGRIVANDTNEALLELHLYDTVQLDNYSRSVVDYWPSLFYPLYLTPQNGIIVLKLSQAAGHEPVVVRIHYSDVVDVPFTLKSHKLKKAQLKILHKLASEKYDDVSAPLWA